MSEAIQERAERYTSAAGIRVNGFAGEAFIENISHEGICIGTRTDLGVTAGERYVIQIRPEPEAGVGVMELEAEARWARAAEGFFTAGFQIRRSDSTLKTYIAYLEGA